MGLGGFRARQNGSQTGRIGLYGDRRAVSGTTVAPATSSRPGLQQAPRTCRTAHVHAHGQRHDRGSWLAVLCMNQPVAQTSINALAPEDLELLGSRSSRYGDRVGPRAVYAAGWNMQREHAMARMVAYAAWGRRPVQLGGHVPASGSTWTRRLRHRRTRRSSSTSTKPPRDHFPDQVGAARLAPEGHSEIVINLPGPLL